MNWIEKKLALGYWKRRVKAFNKGKAKPITYIGHEDIINLQEFYEEIVRKGSSYIIGFDEVEMSSKLRLKNSRMFTDWMIKKLSK